MKTFVKKILKSTFKVVKRAFQIILFFFCAIPVDCILIPLSFVIGCVHVIIKKTTSWVDGIALRNDILNLRGEDLF